MFPSVISVNEVLSGTVIHVGNGGSNANDGTTYALRKALFSDGGGDGALTAVPNGGSIVMWPGTIDDEADIATAAKNITIIGTNPYNCKIASTAGTAMTLNNGCQVANIWLQGHTSGRGLFVSGRDFCRVNNCILESTDIAGLSSHAALTSGEAFILENCWLIGKSRGLSANTGNGIVIKGCLINVGTDATDDSTNQGLIIAAGTTIMDTTIIMNKSGASANDKEITVVTANGYCTLTRCNISITGTLSGATTGNTYAAVVNSAEDGPVILDTCTISNTMTVASGTVFDIMDDNAVCRTIVRNTPYDANKISITGILNNLTDENGKVHASDVDNVGGNTPESLDDAIPNSPTPNSVNALVKRAANRRR